MITKKEITEILSNHAGYIDRSRTEQAVHEDNFNDVADMILSKFSQHDVSVSVCDCMKNLYQDGIYVKCQKCQKTINIQEQNVH